MSRSRIISWVACFGWLLVGCAEPQKATTSTRTVPLAASSPSASAAQARVMPKRPLPAAVEQASSRIVRIVSYVTDGSTPTPTPKHPYPGYRVNGRGLGVVLKQGGFILTSYELLLAKETEALVELIDVQLLTAPREVHQRATLIGVEPTLGLAVIRAPLPDTIQAAAIESRENIEPGNEIYAVTGRNTTHDYVSGHLASLATKECYQESLSETMLRAELELPAAAIGCPVFSASGKVIGINTGYSSLPHEPTRGVHGDTHLLPIDLAINIYQALETKRSMRSPWTGFSVRSLTPQEQKRFPVGHFAGGVALEYIWKNSPAQKLGLKVGDVLVRFGHYPIRDVASFQKWLYMHGVTSQVRLYLLRGHEIIERDYVIEERPRWALPR